PAMSSNSGSHIVLVVDDDAAVRSALKFALEVEGFRVREFAGAVELLGEHNLPPFGCLIVDYRMPIVDGLELVSILRERGNTAPAVVITGRTSKELESKAASVGIRQVLEKPLPNGTLVAAVRAAMVAPVS